MQKIAIIIPCYNEEKRLNEASLLYLLVHSEVTIFLANDGSKDGTLEIIEKFSSLNPERCFVLNYEENQGKANTIYKSVNSILSTEKYDYIGYFDADFSTPGKELVRMISALDKNDIPFLFGSRILLLNAAIKRKWYRHIIGRVVITLINLKFKLGIYDTQCGAKLFSSAIAKEAFAKPFHTSWLFDVEVFLRLKKLNLLSGGVEFPLREWKDIEGSKLGFSTVFKIVKELYQLIKKY